MHTGLQALSTGLQRLGIAAVIIVVGIVIAYVLLVFVIISGQAASALAS